MSRRPREYDESDVRVRASRRGSRPRTKERPRHEDAEIGLVVGVDRGRYTVLLGEGGDERTAIAMKARELGRKGIVVGDEVALVGETSGAADTLARVVRVEPRRSVLRRTADDTDPYERVVVANADQLAVVTALADPEPRPRMVDRCLVAAYDAGLAPLLCLTKSDLAAPDELLAAYRPLGVPAVTTRPTAGDPGVAALLARLSGRLSVLVGHSGVGKSTLVNRLVPDAQRAIGSVNAATGRGRHTSSSAVALPLAGGGWVVDTPGVRSFGLAHVTPDTVVAAFPDLAAGATRCPPGCAHRDAAGGCALDAWVADGHAERVRLDSLRRLLAAPDEPDDYSTDRAGHPTGADR